eukprot:6467941-Amphidinium_carterae.1
MSEQDVDAVSSSGELVRLKVNPAWRNLLAQGLLSLQGTTMDLKAAYKQLAVSPRSLWTALIVVAPAAGRDPDRRIFVQKTLPFGAAASVLHFNRAAKSLHYLGASAGTLMWSPYFDDFTLVEFSVTASSALSLARRLFGMTGWSVASEPRKNLDFVDSLVALGVKFEFGSALTGQLVISNKPERIYDMKGEIDCILDEGRISSKQAAQLRG